MQYLKAIMATVTTLFLEMEKDDCAGLAAEMSYNLLMMLAPSLLLLLKLFHLFGKSHALVKQITFYAYQILPEDVVKTIIDIIKAINANNTEGFVLIGLLATIWATLGGGKVIIKALRRAYNDSGNEELYRLNFVQINIMSFLIMLSLGLGLLLCSNALIISGLLIDYFSKWQSVLLTATSYVANWALIIFFVVIMTGLIYRYVPGYPKKRVEWKIAFSGALFFALMWFSLTLMFAQYIRSFGNYSHVYGAFGTFIVLMLWLYFSALSLLAGGEFNAIFKGKSSVL